MKKTADAVIIGGGAVGTSILYHLTKQGMTDIVLLEKGSLASGSTGDSAAIVRQHYSNEVSIRLVKGSIEIMRGFPDEMGVDVFTQSGWCFLVPPEAESSFVENMAQLQRLGVRTWEISVQEAVEQHLPGLNPDGIGRVAYEPDGGFADPHALCQGFADRARDAGANVYLNTPVTGIKMSGDKVTGVRTPSGEIDSPVVVNAAGPWARPIGQMAGLDLPLEISREQEMMLQVLQTLPLLHAPSQTWSSAYTFVPPRNPVPSSSASVIPRKTSRFRPTITTDTPTLHSSRTRAEAGPPDAASRGCRRSWLAGRACTRSRPTGA